MILIPVIVLQTQNSLEDPPPPHPQVLCNLYFLHELRTWTELTEIGNLN